MGEWILSQIALSYINTLVMMVPIFTPPLPLMHQPAYPAPFCALIRRIDCQGSRMQLLEGMYMSKLVVSGRV